MEISDIDRKVSKSTEVDTTSSDGPHRNHCFVVMPFGRDRDEKRWYRGWYEVVIEPAVRSSGFEPVLSAAEEQPGAINDEIRAHLAFDPMVVVDLGGITPEDAPNPNVMYELGIRHAFGSPLVLMAWEGQQLPFDVSNQRAIIGSRGLLDLEPTKKKLDTFVRAAVEGRFYNPMESVGREASLDATALVLGEESLLGALTKEVQELRGAISTSRLSPHKGRVPTFKNLMGKEIKSALWPVAKSLGYDTSSWGKFLRQRVGPDDALEMRDWSIAEWKLLVEDETATISIIEAEAPERRLKVSEGFINAVAELLPEQPWRSGIHKEIAERLSVPINHVSLAIKELIRRGEFRDQVDGVLVDPDDHIELEPPSDRDSLE